MTELGPKAHGAMLTESEPLSLIGVAESTGDAAKRCFDFVSALILILVLSPVFALGYLASKFYGYGFSKSLRVQRGGKPFFELSLRFPPKSRWNVISRLPVLINILRGEMSWVGPAPKAPAEIEALGQIGRYRLKVRPGLLCQWRIQRRANISYESESQTAAQYVDSHSLLTDLGLIARGVVVAIYGLPTPKTASTEINLMGVRVDNVTMNEAVNAIVERVGGGSPCQVSFLNAHCFNVLQRDPLYLESVNSSRLVFPDGIGLKIAGQLLGCPITQNVNGTDLFPMLCKALESKQRSLYLLGGKPGTTEDVTKWLSSNYPNLVVLGSHHGYDLKNNTEKVIGEIRASGADLVLVGLGVPMQERWINQNLPEIGAKVVLGVGGLFDYYSGRIPRAPIWMRELGLEWFFRFLQEPRRLCKRYFVGNLTFLLLVLRYWMDRRTEGSKNRGLFS
jgi:N-acetylglucosaminyldiphosphoundecaprenol N-acetyl-beta-D-mannosaminyltransferase